jgi:hypothetical protein
MIFQHPGISDFPGLELVVLLSKAVFRVLAGGKSCHMEKSNVED